MDHQTILIRSILVIQLELTHSSSQFHQQPKKTKEKRHRNVPELHKTSEKPKDLEKEYRNVLNHQKDPNQPKSQWKKETTT